MHPADREHDRLDGERVQDVPALLARVVVAIAQGAGVFGRYARSRACAQDLRVGLRCRDAVCCAVIGGGGADVLEGQEAAQQRRGVALVDSPGLVRAARGVQRPASTGERGGLRHLQAGLALDLGGRNIEALAGGRTDADALRGCFGVPDKPCHPGGKVVTNQAPACK